MAIARDSIVFSGFLFEAEASHNISHLARSLLATQSSCFSSSSLSKTYVGEAHVTLSDTLLKWLSGGPTAIQIGSIMFNNLPAGMYIVEAYSHNAVSDALSGQYVYKTLFQGVLDVTVQQSPLSSSLNSVTLPIALNSAQSTLNIILRIRAYSLRRSEDLQSHNEDPNFRSPSSNINADSTDSSFSAAAVLVRKSLA